MFPAIKFYSGSTHSYLWSILKMTIIIKRCFSLTDELSWHPTIFNHLMNNGKFNYFHNWGACASRSSKQSNRWSQILMKVYKKISFGCGVKSSFSGLVRVTFSPKKTKCHTSNQADIITIIFLIFSIFSTTFDIFSFFDWHKALLNLSKVHDFKMPLIKTLSKPSL